MLHYYGLPGTNLNDALQTGCRILLACAKQDDNHLSIFEEPSHIPTDGVLCLVFLPRNSQHRNHQTRTGSTHPPRSKRRQVKATGFGRLQGLQPLEALEAIHQAA